jgi:hypothetical protein
LKEFRDKVRKEKQSELHILRLRDMEGGRGKGYGGSWWRIWLSYILFFTMTLFSFLFIF